MRPLVAVASAPHPVPLARAFLALSDPVDTARPARVGTLAALVAVLVLAVGAPVSAAGVLAAAGENRAAATLPAKTALSGDDDGPAPEGG